MSRQYLGSCKARLAVCLAVTWGASQANAFNASTGGAAFQWMWSTNVLPMDSTDLTQCRTYSIATIPLPSNKSSVGTPPFYMMAWKRDGIPTVSYLGDDGSKLSWTVNQAIGSTLMLTVADSLGNSGGTPTSFYKVSNGSDSSCLPPAPSTNITLAANLSTSDDLETCEPLGLRVIGGGQKPYTISLTALNSPVITNVTLEANDDVMTWPNLADPNGQLMASVSDANGVWGTSTGFFKTTGRAVQNDATCAVKTSTGNSANVDQHPPQVANASSSSSNSSSAAMHVAPLGDVGTGIIFSTSIGLQLILGALISYMF